MVVGPNLGGNVEPAPSIAKWQTIKQHWHMHSTMTKTGGEAGRGRVDMAKMCAVCVVCTCWRVCCVHQ